LSFGSPNDGTNIVIDVTGWEMIESITWYQKNTKETLPKFQENNIYIKEIGNYEYIYIYIYIYIIFWVYKLGLLYCRNFDRNLVEPVYIKKLPGNF